MKLKYSTVIKVLIWVHFIMWILIIPITEFQLMLFGKKIITLFTLGVIELIISFFLIIILILRKKIYLNSVCILSINFVLVMIFFWLIGFAINVDTPLYWKFYYIFYWIMPVVLIIIGSQIKFNFRPILKAVAIMAFINAVFVLVQHFSNNLIWPFDVDDLGNTLFFISSEYYNSELAIRCPGICMSGLDSGALMIFGMLFVIGEKKLKTWKRVLLITFFIYATWYTGTRNIYLFLGFVMVGMLINYCFKEKYKLKKNLTVLYTIFSFLTVIFMQINLGSITQNATRSIITDFTSMNIRIISWNNALKYFSSGNIFQQLFGRSIWQSAGYPLVLDNMYLELLIMVGIIGMLCFCFFIFKLSLVAIRTKETSIIPYYSYVLGFFIYGTLNVIGSLNLTFLMIFGLYLSQLIGSEKNENQHCD
ncbi:hypothetical protein [Lapidilactobacillus luobeiensis]|uniref:hypothetical protein n=1 Tax=Lapidilactobacillus luobeiensis TaxID=2950371 RepID=UPI0021C49BDF|nr:hypothetical protein [Lapidilactobacillus luobeiensis]